VLLLAKYRIRVHSREARSSAIPLIEQHETIGVWIEEPAVPLQTPRTGATGQDDGKLAAWSP
jgi:hypothetical protein